MICRNSCYLLAILRCLVLLAVLAKAGCGNTQCCTDDNPQWHNSGALISIQVMSQGCTEGHDCTFWISLSGLVECASYGVEIEVTVHSSDTDTFAAFPQLIACIGSAHGTDPPGKGVFHFLQEIPPMRRGSHVLHITVVDQHHVISGESRKLSRSDLVFDVHPLHADETIDEGVQFPSWLQKTQAQTEPLTEHRSSGSSSSIRDSGAEHCCREIAELRADVSRLTEELVILHSRLQQVCPTTLQTRHYPTQGRRGQKGIYDREGAATYASTSRVPFPPPEAAEDDNRDLAHSHPTNDDEFVSQSDRTKEKGSLAAAGTSSGSSKECSHNTDTAPRHPPDQAVAIMVPAENALTLIHQRRSTVPIIVRFIVPEIVYKFNAQLFVGGDKLLDTWQYISARAGDTGATIELTLPALSRGNVPHTLKLRVYEITAAVAEAGS